MWKAGTGSRITNFWGVLADGIGFSALQRRLQATPFSEIEWRNSLNFCLASEVDRAASFFVKCRQSLAGRMDTFAPLSRSRTRRGMSEQASAWISAIEGLPEVHERLRRVVILNRPALDCIASQDGPDTLFYLDPPYLHETRSTVGEYEHEMSTHQHEELLQRLASLQGRFILSGYRSRLYDNFARDHGWQRREFTIANCAASGSRKRNMIECVWMNYVPTQKDEGRPMTLEERRMELWCKIYEASAMNGVQIDERQVEADMAVVHFDQTLEGGFFNNSLEVVRQEAATECPPQHF